MELFIPKTKEIQEGTSQVQKIKKPTLKEFLIFQEMAFSSPKLTKLLIFFCKQFFLYFRRELSKSLLFKIKVSYYYNKAFFLIYIFFYTQ